MNGLVVSLILDTFSSEWNAARERAKSDQEFDSLDFGLSLNPLATLGTILKAALESSTTEMLDKQQTAAAQAADQTPVAT